MWRRLRRDLLMSAVVLVGGTAAFILGDLIAYGRVTW
jgi:hypothetical protein